MRDKTRKRFLNRGTAFLMALLMVVSLLPVGAQRVVAADGEYTVTTDLNTKEFVVEEATGFSVTTNVPTDEADPKTVLGHFKVTDSEGKPVDESVMKLEYLETQEPQNDQWFSLPMSDGEGDFGPDSGFPMSNATIQFRVTFGQAGNYKVKISIQSVEDRTELCTTEEIQISAVEEHTVTLDCGEGGTAKLTAGSQEGSTSLIVEDGTEVTLEAKADEGYQIASVTINDVPKNIEDGEREQFTETVKITGDTDIEVTFVRVYEVTISWNENGSVETDTEPAISNGGTVVVEKGDSVTITATPEENYQVTQVVTNDVPETLDRNKYNSENPYKMELTPDQDYKITVTFALKSYTVTTDYEENGTVSTSQPTVDHGGDAEISIKPNEGYTVKTVEVNGKLFEAIDIEPVKETEEIRFTIENITEDTTVQVTFAENIAISMSGLVTFDSDYVRENASGLYVYAKDKTVTFKAVEGEIGGIKEEINGIRLYDETGARIDGGGIGKNEVEIAATTQIGRIDVYYWAEGDWYFGWHQVSGVDSAKPISIVVDKTAPEVSVKTDREADKNGYYNKDVTVTVEAVDNALIKEITGSNAGIAKIQYQVKNGEDITQGMGQNGDENAGILYLHSEAEGDEIQDSVTEEFVVEVEQNNGDDIQVIVIVTDRAGNETTKTIELKMDDTPPAEWKIEYQNPSWVENLLENISFGFYQAETEVTISAMDETSGIESFAYSCVLEEGASSINKPFSGQIEEKDFISNENGTAKASFKIPAEFRGYVTFTATDKAGNDSEVYAESDKILVVDNTAPGVSVKYDTTNALNYYQSRTATIEIDEANFFAQDIEEGYLVITVGKRVNGEADYTEETVTDLQFEPTREGDVYTATIEFIDDADYTFDIRYKDRSGNVYDEYNQDSFTIDTTLPEIEVAYDNNDCLNDNQFKADRTATITIEEHNFDPSGVAVTVTAKDAAGKDVEVEDYDAYLKESTSWTSDGDVHTAVITFTEEANYTFDISYTDLAGNSNNGIVDYGTSKAPTEFTIDKTIPTASIQIGNWTESVNGDKWDHFLENISFELWDNKTLEVTVKNDDSLSGVDIIEHFRTDEPMTLAQVEAYEDWTKVPAPEKNRVFSYSVEPDERFIVYVHIVDKAGNELYLSSDGIILDETLPEVEKVAPQITVQPAQPVNGIYNTDVKMDVQVKDPAAAGDALLYSGLRSVTYEVYNNSESTTEPTQQGILFDVENTSLEADVHGLIQSWQEDGCITVDRNLNNSNNVVVKITATDNAGNVSTATCDLKIDITAPTIDISYNNNNADSETYFREDRTATIVVHERNFDPEDVELTITNTDGVIPTISGWSRSVGTGNGDDTAWTATVTYAAEGDYTFAIAYTDLAGNRCAGEQYAAGTVAPQEFTVDKTLPEISVSYDNNAAENTNYYKDARTATVTVTEHNFDPSRVEITMTATDDGAAASVPGVSGWSSDGDRHTATISFDGDALYSLDIAMRDMAGNEAADFAQQTFYVDRTAPVLEITGVEDNSANNGDVIPVVTYSDTNFDPEAVTITLTGANRGQVTLDGSYEDIHNGQVFTFENFPNTKEMDDIYTLEATLTDRAGNTTTQTIHFSVNRFGSTYAVSEETASLNGSYVQEPVDVVITEVNANELKNIKITLFKNNETITLTEGEDYSVSVQGGNGSWYEYTYTIFAENFTDDGVYRITVHSEDTAGNVAENTLDTKGTEISFGVDKTSPNVVITNLESGKTYAVENLTVTMTAEDNLLLDSITVYLDDYETAYKTWTAEEIAEIIAENGEFTFDISGDSTSAHRVKVVCTDAAGNQTESEITDFFVTTNLWVRYYNNKPLFFGSIAGVVVLAGVVIALVVVKKKKKEVK